MIKENFKRAYAAIKEEIEYIFEDQDTDIDKVSYESVLQILKLTKLEQLQENTWQSFNVLDDMATGISIMVQNPEAPGRPELVELIEEAKEADQETVDRLTTVLKEIKVRGGGVIEIRMKPTTEKPAHVAQDKRNGIFRRV